jgi:hypothetical protein
MESSLRLFEHFEPDRLRLGLLRNIYSIRGDFVKMKHGEMCAKLILVIFILTAILCSHKVFGQEGSANTVGAAAKIWPSQPPADIPFEASKDLTGIAFTGRHAQYAHADTWYPSWAANGNMYSPWTDGSVNGVHSGSGGPNAITAFATIIGDDPMNLTITGLGTYPSVSTPYGGRYPAGSLVYKGVWYYGTYCLNQTPGTNLNWDVLGPFVGFRHSTDYGKTWLQTKHTPDHPLFKEPDHIGGKVKLGLPHVVDFGQEMQYSPDGKAYIVSHGASDSNPHPRNPVLSWITGDEIYLARVTPSVHNMETASKYEFFAGHDRKGKAIWTHNFSRIKPLLKWDNNMGSVTITYDAPLKKYLMAVTDGKDTISRFNTYILESSEITGPWKLVTYMRDFGVQGYFANFPSKFISKDGRTAWLSYSANFAVTTPPFWVKKGGEKLKSDPEGSGYWWTLQEVRLLGPEGAK